MTESGWNSWEGLEQKGVQKGGFWDWLLQETEIRLPSLWLSKPVGDFTVPTNILFGVWCFEGQASSKHLHWMVENWVEQRGRGSHETTSPWESDWDSSGHGLGGGGGEVCVHWIRTERHQNQRLDLKYSQSDRRITTSIQSQGAW